MRQIRLSGREATVIRALGFGLPVGGAALIENTRLSPEDLADVLSGLMDAGFVESTPYAEKADAAALETTEFDVNSAYAHELKIALGFGRKHG